MIKIEIPDLPKDASVSEITISCTSVEAYESALRYFNALDCLFSGAFIDRVSTFKIGELSVTIELSEVRDKRKAWIERYTG